MAFATTGRHPSRLVDRLRDQAHAVAGIEALRFTFAQVRYEPARVEMTLRRVIERLVQAD